MPPSRGSISDLPLQAARDIASFVESPIDRFVARRCFCFWQLGTNTKGLIAWGDPTADDALEMTRAFEVGAREDEPHVSLVDMRSLRTIDVAAFEVIMRYMAERQEVFARTVRRQALVHGTGAIGAAVAGFYQVVQPAYPVESLPDVNHAIEWLAPPAPEVVRALVTDLRLRHIDVAPVVSRLRAVLSSSGHIMSLPEAARALGTSRRSLQRDLDLTGSSFREEVARYRLARAEQLLAGSNMPLKSVAAAIELAPSRLTALFRQHHGVSPAAWRARFVRVASDVPELAAGDSNGNLDEPS
jgi:AraC-like DNA-binding protein